MSKTVLETLLQQILFFSENGTSYIEHPFFVVAEVAKISGASREETVKMFKKLNEINFIEKVPDEEYAYRVKNIMSIDKLKELVVL